MSNERKTKTVMRIKHNGKTIGYINLFKDGVAPSVFERLLDPNKLRPFLDAVELEVYEPYEAQAPTIDF